MHRKFKQQVLKAANMSERLFCRVSVYIGPYYQGMNEKRTEWSVGQGIEAKYLCSETRRRWTGKYDIISSMTTSQKESLQECVFANEYNPLLLQKVFCQMNTYYLPVEQAWYQNLKEGNCFQDHYK